MGDPDYQTAYRQFLEQFANKIDTFSAEECETPFRLVTYQLVPSEVEGECLEWIRRYLSLNDCPLGVVSQLSRAVYKMFADSLSLSHFYLEPDDKHSRSDEDENGHHVEDSHSDSSSDDGHVRNSGPPQLDAGRLLQEVVAFIHTTVKSWNTCPPVLSTQPSTLQVYSHAIKNTRRKMEDRHVLIPDLHVLYDLKDTPRQSYFAVFDGHGGLEAAEYAATHLHGHLVSDQAFHTDPEAAMIQAYKTTDVKFLEKAKREGLRSGTTGVSVLIRESEMFVGWLGDSQALLVCSGQPVQIMTPHKPEREDERRRIEDLGGFVLFLGVWRVNGNISVSRAIGDAQFKPYVSSDADVTRIPLTGEEEYLVLACDGLWDVLTPSQVTNIVYKHSRASPGGVRNVAVELVNAARDSDSSDNISVVVILFKSSLSAPKAASAGSAVFGLSQVSEKSPDTFDTSSSFSKPATLNARLISRANGKPQDIQKENASLGLTSKDIQKENASLGLTSKDIQKESASLGLTSKDIQKESASLCPTSKDTQKESASLCPTSKDIQKENASLGLTSSCRSFHSTWRKPVASSCSSDCSTEFGTNGTSFAYQEQFLQKSTELDIVSVWRLWDHLLNRHIRSTNKQSRHQPAVESKDNSSHNIASTYSIPFPGILCGSAGSLSNYSMCHKCRHRWKLAVKEFLQGVDTGTGHPLSSPSARCTSVCVLYMYFRHTSGKCHSGWSRTCSGGYCARAFNRRCLTPQQKNGLGHSIPC